MFRLNRISAFAALLCLSCVGIAADADQVQSGDQVIKVSQLANAPVIDGYLDDWERVAKHNVTVRPAVENDPDNHTGTVTVELAVGYFGDSIYVAARWPDSTQDINYRPWNWRDGKYQRDKRVDDMFALRLNMGMEFSKCMLSGADYQVDLWLWSAGRSNAIGFATDYMHIIGSKFVEGAAEHKDESGKTVYIQKIQDQGIAGFRNNRPPKEKTEKVLPGVIFDETPEGSVADIKAKGVWENGFWSLELTRKLDTVHADDALIKRGADIITQLALYDKTFAQHKSISAPLILALDQK